MAEGLAQIGETWSGYTILEFLGHCGLGERYRVRGEDGRKRLLDVLAVHHPKLMERLQEAELGRIDHPNVLRVRGIVSVFRFPGVIYDDAHGQPLAAWMKAEPDTGDRLAVLHGLAAGLDALHGANLSHGYVQTESVMIEQGRRRPIARLGLPGVGAIVSATLRDGGAMTTSGASLGDMSFQAPEKQRNPAVNSPPADVFSLGCLAYYLLAGRGPFQGQDPVTCYENARSGNYPRLRESDELHPEIVTMIDEMLRPEPLSRPTAAAVAAKLDRIVPPEGRGMLLLAGVLFAGSVMGIFVLVLVLLVLAWL